MATRDAGAAALAVGRRDAAGVQTFARTPARHFCPPERARTLARAYTLASAARRDVDAAWRHLDP
ncbi:hypothetical protein EON68_04590 [archaeon]|nr:MAG: hypothetical protein EON68_04590 [archaeon]